MVKGGFNPLGTTKSLAKYQKKLAARTSVTRERPMKARDWPLQIFKTFLSFFSLGDQFASSRWKPPTGAHLGHPFPPLPPNLIMAPIVPTLSSPSTPDVRLFPVLFYAWRNERGLESYLLRLAPGPRPTIWRPSWKSTCLLKLTIWPIVWTSTRKIVCGFGKDTSFFLGKSLPTST